MKRIYNNGNAAILMAALFWSLQGVLGKANAWGSFSLVGVRAVFASVVLGCARRSFRLPRKPADWLAGAFVALTALLYLVANRLTSAANAIILQYTMPMFVMLISVVFLKKKPGALDVIVSVCVLGGIFMCVSGGAGSGNALGDLLALLSAVTYAGIFCAGRMLGSDPADYSYTGNVLCVLLVAAIPFDPEFSFSASGIVSAAVMGVTVGLGYILFGVGMRAGVSPTTAAILANVEPIATPVWVFLFLGEAPSPLSIAGFCVVLVAISVYGLLQSKTPRE